MALYLLDQIKPLLGVALSDTSDDDALDACRAAVESHLANLTRLRLEPATVTEFYAGNWARTLRLRQRPVRSVATVRIWPQGADNFGGQGDDPGEAPEAELPGRAYWLRMDWQTTEATPVQLSMGGLLERPELWPGALERRRGRVVRRPVTGPGNVEVVSEVGFPLGHLPAEFLPAVAAGVRLLRNQVKTGGLTVASESRNGWSVSLTEGPVGKSAEAMVGMLGDVQLLVARYRRPFVG